MLNYSELKHHEPIVILGHLNSDVDSLTSCYLMSLLLDFHGIKSVVCIPDNKIDPLYDIEKYKFKFKTKLEKDDELFLVDHIDEYENNVVGCIDHHPSNLSLEINYIYKPQTSCSKIIYDEMINDGFIVNEAIINLVIYSLYMDSISFISKKALQEDKDWAKEQIEIYKLNEEYFYNSGLCLNDISVIDETSITYGRKDYIINSKKIISSYIIIDKMISKEKISKIIDRISTIKQAGCMWMFFINCLEEYKTYVYYINDDYYECNCFNEILSRGKNLIPMLGKKLSNDNITEKLISNKLTISTMESCTSGLIASTITDTEGASSIISGSMITYSNEAKIKEGVDENIIKHYGVYSLNTAIDMAKKCKDKYNSKIAIGVTGSTGNVDLNNKDSKVGNVFYSVIINDNTYNSEIIFKDNKYTRKEFKEKIVEIILSQVNSLI